MKNQKLTSPLFWAAILGAIKIVLDTIGIQVIDNQKVDALANGIAATVAIIGIFVDHGATVKQITAQDVLDGVTKLVADLQPVIGTSGETHADAPFGQGTSVVAEKTTTAPEPLGNSEQLNQ